MFCLPKTAWPPTSERSGESWKSGRDGDRSLQLLVLNEEFLVSASHQLALITSLPFVHNAKSARSHVVL